jgi:hypothetical protein
LLIRDGSNCELAVSGGRVFFFGVLHGFVDVSGRCATDSSQHANRKNSIGFHVTPKI